jgi:hypothetical protein
MAGASIEATLELWVRIPMHPATYSDLIRPPIPEHPATLAAAPLDEFVDVSGVRFRQAVQAL